MSGYKLIPKCVLLAAIAASFIGCVTPKPHLKTYVSAPIRNDTEAARILDPVTNAHPGESGYYLLPDGEDAFLARIAAIELAQDTIEAQYYIFKNDLTGRIFLERLLNAADRGVKVRLLVDDLAKTWKDRYLGLPEKVRLAI